MVHEGRTCKVDKVDQKSDSVEKVDTVDKVDTVGKHHYHCRAEVRELTVVYNKFKLSDSLFYRIDLL